MVGHPREGSLDTKGAGARHERPVLVSAYQYGSRRNGPFPVGQLISLDVPIPPFPPVRDPPRPPRLTVYSFVGQGVLR